MYCFDLSNAQIRTIVTEVGESGNDSYILSFKCKFPLEDEKYVKKALNKVINGNLNLRIKKDKKMNFVQYFNEKNSEGNAKNHFSYTDMSIEKEEEINEFIYNFVKTPFDTIFDSPLYKFAILKTRENIIVLANVHHIIMDGTSINLFVKELKKVIDKIKNNLDYTPEYISYEKYVEKEKEYLSSTDAKKDEDYWIKKLKNYSYNWLSTKNLNVVKHEITFNKKTITKLKNLSLINKNKISPFVLALAINSLYFLKNSENKELVWNTSYHGRNFGEDINNMVGMFVNMLPLKLRYDENKTFQEYLFYVKSVLKEGLSHGKLSFNIYTQKLQKLGINPAMLSTFSIVSNSADSGVEYIWENEESEFPLHIRVNSSLDDEKGLQTLLLEFNTGCYSNEEISEIVSDIEKLVENIANNPYEKCRNIKVPKNKYYKAENYFKEIIKNSDGETFIPPNIATKDKGKIKEKQISLDKNKIEQFSKRNNISVNSLFLSSTIFTLSKFVFNKNILISRATKSNGESRKLPFGLKLNSEKSLKELLIDVENKIGESEYFKSYPYNSIVSENTINPDFGYYGLENNKINSEVENYNRNISYNDNIDDNDLIDESLNIENKRNKASIFVKSLNEKEFKLILKYNDGIYTEKLMDIFLKSIQIIIDKIMKDDLQKLKDVSILSEEELKKEEKRQKSFKAKNIDEPLLNKAFEKCVEKNKDKIALITEDGELTYDKLNKKTNRIANYLIKKGVEVEDRIMFLLNRDSDLIATVLGIIKAGCVFIPVDPEYPKERIKHILKDSKSKYIITNETIAKKFQNLPNQIYIGDILKETDDSNPNIPLKEENLAYIIYTSGSTGTPKGVMLTHKGITNYIFPDSKNIPIYALTNKTKKMLSLTTVSFIVFLREIFATMVNGISVVFANEEESINPLKLVKLFNKTKPDAFGSTPSRMLQYLEIEEVKNIMNNFKVIIIGGEMFPPQLYRNLRSCTDAEIYNSYGPTEITIASHGKLMNSDKVSEGKPLLNVIDSIRDIDGNPLPPGIVGEIYIGGFGVAKGYLNNEELTNEKFIKICGIPYYKTGDLGKKDETGELFVSGRVDTQVKVRGLRIEVSEIESVISESPDIISVTVSVKDIDNEDYLCAYLTSKTEIDTNDLKEKLANKLPKYMVPSYLIQLKNFPMTPNGKINVKKLPTPSVSDYISDYIVKPENELEQDIFNICSKIIKRDNFGVTTNLLQIGFTSLSIIKLISKISKEFGVELNLVNIMREGNIRKIVEEISKSTVIEEYNVEKKKFYPLTQSQMGVYFDCVKNPEKLMYNIPKCLHFSKNINVEKLRKAVIKTVDKHPYIKTKLVIKDGIVCQERLDDLKIDVDIYEGVVDDKIKIDFVRPFPLLNNQLFRFLIYKNADEVCLLCDFHHIILDGGSLDIFLKDLTTIYEGGVVEEETYTGFDLSLDEVETQKSDLYKEAEAYFENKVGKLDGGTLISPDMNNNEEDGGMGEISIFMDKSNIENFCKNIGITPNNLFLSSTIFTLSKFVFNKNILISIISSGRSHIKYQNTLGMMVKTLPYALKIDTYKNTLDFLSIVQDALLDVIKYECYPFTKISDKYDIFPEFLYAYQTGVVSKVEINGEKVELESLELATPKFKLSIAIEDTEDKFKIVSQYNDAIYSENLMEIFIQSIATTVNKIMKNPDALLKDLSIISEDKTKGFKLNPVKEQLLNKVFEGMVEQNKNKIALISKDGEFTYDELNKKANRVSNALIKRGVSVEDRIMFIMKRDSRLIATMIGIMKAGCAFIPVDPEYPDERIKHILEDSDAKFIITDGSLSGGLDVDELLAETNEENPSPDLIPDNLCYMIYTSGSTGKPKGVMLTHEGITNYVYPNSENCYVNYIANNLNNYLSLTTVSFDVFIEEIFVPLMNGLTVILANDEETTNPLLLANLMNKQKIEGISVTPSRLLQYLELENMKKAIHGCKSIIVGGEGFPPQLYPLLTEYTDAKIWNSYGPTEITIASHGKLLSGDNVAVGKPLFNVVDMIADDDGNPLPHDVVGELYVGGSGVSRGYWNLDERNKEQFLVIDGITYYKTGDFAKKDENGEVFILGRLDNQIKLRGLRIEIGEIESTISNYESIKSVAVLIRNVSSNDHLCAYFTADTKIDIEDLKIQLKNKLTKYMVPTVFLQLDKLPQTPNGKTDVKALPEPVLREREYVAPENDVEKFFAETFSKVLDMPKIGVTDNFFDLGGTSLLATKIIIEGINYNYDISYGDIFSYQTPRELAKSVLNSENSKNAPEYEEFAYGEIDTLLEKNTLESFRSGHLQELGNVLLTGATGFLGIHILHDFLENETGMIYCLLRKGRRGTGLEDRLKTILFYYFSESYDDLFGSRIHIIEGDISNSSDFNKALDFPIDTVINCAANVKHYASGTQIEDINVGGVINTIEFCKKKNTKLVQISTVSVGGWSVGNVPPLDKAFDEKMLFIGQNLDHKYIYSKFKAECIILEAVLDGLNAKIMRVGNLMARSEDSEFQINFETNAFINSLKSYSVIKKIPYSILGSETELTPIDTTARAILLLTRTPDECVVFHPYNNHSIYISDIVEIMNNMGLSVLGAEENEFDEELSKTMKDEIKSTAISGIITTIKKDGKTDKVGIPVVNEYTTQILYRLGFKWPLTTDQYLSTFIKYLIEMGFFDVN